MKDKTFVRTMKEKYGIVVDDKNHHRVVFNNIDWIPNYYDDNGLIAGGGCIEEEEEEEEEE
jgi:hypothetical protein